MRATGWRERAGRGMIIAGLVLLAALWGTGAAAAARPQVTVTGDVFETSETESTAIFSGNVVVTQTGLKVNADRLVVHYGGGGARDIKTFDASGNVKITTPDQVATGNKAIYDPNTNMLHLTGNVVVVNDAGTVRGPELIVNLDDNTSRFVSDGSGGRVTGVFTPQAPN